MSIEHSLVNQYVAEIRDVHIQKDRMRFRRNLERIAEIAAFEISKEMHWLDKEVTTPLGTAKCQVLAEQPVIANILRAGTTMHNGLLNYFDRAENAFVTAYRKHEKDGSFNIEMEYLTSPNLNGRYLLVADPMLASGSSMSLALNALYQSGKPKVTHIICAIAARPGVDRIRKELPEAHIWTGAIDDELNDHAYIIPGLGDAGDLAYGEKIQS